MRGSIKDGDRVVLLDGFLEWRGFKVNLISSCLGVVKAAKEDGAWVQFDCGAIAFVIYEFLEKPQLFK